MAAGLGCAPDDLAPRRLCTLVYTALTDGKDAKDRAKVDASLDRPLPGQPLEAVAQDPRSAWSADSEMAAFANAASGLGPTGGAAT